MNQVKMNQIKMNQMNQELSYLLIASTLLNII